MRKTNMIEKAEALLWYYKIFLKIKWIQFKYRYIKR